MKGKIFGRWEILGCLWRDEKSHKWWLCRCECGTIRNVRESDLRRGHSRSCGCLNREQRKANGYKYLGSNNPNWKENKKDSRILEPRIQNTIFNNGKND